MIIKLTSEQLELVKDRLEENLQEEKELRKKDKNNEPVSGWEIVALEIEQGVLEDVIKKGYTEL